MKKLMVLLLAFILMIANDVLAWNCSECGNNMEGKFCSECGEKKPEKVCSYCGASFGENSPNFCSECGAKQMETKENDTTELTASAKGFGGDVTVTITLDYKGAIDTIHVDAPRETRGIGTLCTEDAFLSQFIGRKGPFDNIDAVTGATYTSNAVVEAVNLLFLDDLSKTKTSDSTVIAAESQLPVWVKGLYRSNDKHLHDLKLMRYDVYSYINIGESSVYVAAYMTDTITAITGEKVLEDGIANRSWSLTERVDSNTYRCLVNYTDRITKKAHKLDFTFTFTQGGLVVECISTTEEKGQETIFVGKYSLVK